MFKDTKPLHITLRKLKEKVEDEYLRYQLLTYSILLGAYDAKKGLGDRYFTDKTAIVRDIEEGNYLAMELEQTLGNLSTITAEKYNEQLKSELEELLKSNSVQDKDLKNRNYSSIYVFLRRILLERPNSSFPEIGKKLERILLKPYQGEDLNEWYNRNLNELKSKGFNETDSVYIVGLDRLYARCFGKEQSRVYEALKKVIYSEEDYFHPEED